MKAISLERVSPRTQARIRRVWTRSAAHAVLMVFGIVFMVPFAWLVSTSLKPDKELFALVQDVGWFRFWIPSEWRFQNYPGAWGFIPFGRYTLNTTFLGVMNVSGTLFSSTLVAYGFSRIRWPGRNALFFVMVSTLAIPYFVTLVPQYLIFRRFEMVGTYWPLILPSFVGVPFFIFLLRQFYLTIPMELAESAKIDGANELMIFWRIIIPLSRPAMATVALFTFINEWNSFIAPLIYLNDQMMWPLGIGLYGFYTRMSAEWGFLMAASVMVISPIVILFFFTQKTFIQGITLTGLKG